MHLFHSILGVLLLFGESDPTLKHASVSTYAVNLTTNACLLDEKSDLSLVPASCMKLATTAAALHILGPERRFETLLEYDGFIDKKGVLHGNLYIRGDGDPCLGLNKTASSLSYQEQLQVWVEAVQKQGISKIEGKVIGDDSKWERARAVPSWLWEDLGNYFGAGASALSFHENEYTLTFKPGNSVGEATIILKIDPPIESMILHNEVKTGPLGSGDQAWIYGSEFSDVRYARGTVPMGVAEFSIRGSIPDPAKTTALLLQKALEKCSISVGQKEIPSKKRNPFHTTYSPSVKEIVHLTNLKSVDLYAEHLLKKMGEVVYQDGSTQGGIKAVTAFLNSKKIDLEGFCMADGSGLSRKNLMTTKQLVSILLMMRESPHFALFLDSLPKIADGIQAKSGSMSLIKGQAGYTKESAFAILVNQCLEPDVIKKIDKFLIQFNGTHGQSKL